MPSEETTIICGATVRTWTLYTGLALLWLMMAMIQYYTSICGDGGIVVGATLDEQFVSEFERRWIASLALQLPTRPNAPPGRMHTTIPLQWVAPMALCGLCGYAPVVALAAFESSHLPPSPAQLYCA